MGDLYSWLKALHIIAVISWMAGLLYLPRLFVYHCDAEPGSHLSETLKVMERRLLRAIMTPAMVVSWGLGLGLLHVGQAWSGGAWIWLKLALVIALSAMHFAMARWRKDFADDANRHSAKFFRMANEVPTVLMVLIVICVVIKPF